VENSDDSEDHDVDLLNAFLRQALRR
jgi:hypothetical protein